MATVDDLLRQLHHRVAELTRDCPTSPTRFDAHLSAWRTLASRSRRTLDQLVLPPEDRELPRLLERIEASTCWPGAPPDPRVSSVALHVGGIGDVLAGARSEVEKAGRADRLRLQANLQAALHATARCTFAVGEAAGRHDHGSLLRRLVDATELAALLPPRARASSLDRLTVVRLSPHSLDGAVGLWANQAGRVLDNHLLVTGVILTETAGTLAILCAAASRNVAAVARGRTERRDHWWTAAHLLRDAAFAWHRAAVWPTNVQLGGRQLDYRAAMKLVRDNLRGPAFNHLSRGRRIRMLREAISVARGIGGLQARAVVQLASWRGLWIARPRANLRPAGMRPRVPAGEWGRLEWTHPERQQLIDTARAADEALALATAGFDEAVLPVPSQAWDTTPLTLVDGRITAAYELRSVAT